jgi:hypothetical protein
MKTPFKILFTLIASVSPFLLFAQTDALYINPNGNVGIHTTEPKAILQINGGETETNNPVLLNLYLPHFRFPAADWAGQYESFHFLQTNIGSELKKYGFKSFNVGAGGVSIGYDITPGAKSAAALYVNGLVGIGTTNPTSPLQIARTSDLAQPMLSLDQTTQTWVTTTRFDNYRYLQTNFAGAQTDGNFKQFNVGPGGVGIGYNPPSYNSNNALYVNGYLGIKTDAPAYPLDLNGVAHFYGNTTDIPSTGSGGLVISWNKSQGAGETNFYNTTGPQGTKGGFTFININKTEVQKELMSITEDGRVGIGHLNPDFPLDVRGMIVVNNPNRKDVGEKDVPGKPYGYNHEEKPITIRSEYGVMAGYGYYLTSDRRIKKSITAANNFADLDLLNQFKVVSFQYKDSLGYGNGFVKGFIAQEVEKLYPQAVNTVQDFIPSVYQNSQQCLLANGRLTVKLEKPHQLVNGDVVRLITNEQKVKEMPITLVDGKTFTVAGWDGNADKVFVYGKRVTDFKSIDYQQIFALGISSIQQLSKEMDNLKTKNEMLQEMVKKMEDRLLSLEKRLAVSPIVAMQATAIDK